MSEAAVNPLAVLGERVAYKRKKMGLSQPELVQRMNATLYRPGISQNHISNIERGKGEKLPSVRSLAAMAEAFGTSMDYLAGLSESDAPGKAEPYRVAVNAADEEERALLQELFDIIHGRSFGDQQFIVSVVRRLGSSPAPKPPLIIGE